MSSFKAAAFDLDDTLLRDDLSVSDYTAGVFRRLTDTGFLLIPASGRAQLSMLPFVEQIRPVALYIACNGAEIWDGATDQLISRETFSMELGCEIAEFGKEFSCYAQTYEGEKFFFNEYGLYADRYAAASMLTGEYVGDLTKFIREPRTKILMMAEPDKISMMLSEACRRFENRVSVTSSKPHFLEFNPLRATKGIALSAAADRLGISTEQIVAFGDSLNDLPMLQEAGLSVAVANARPVVRNLCDAVCPCNQEDGVALFLAKHILCEEALF